MSTAPSAHKTTCAFIVPGESNPSGTPWYDMVKQPATASYWVTTLADALCDGMRSVCKTEIPDGRDTDEREMGSGAVPTSHLYVVEGSLFLSMLMYPLLVTNTCVTGYAPSHMKVNAGGRVTI